MARSLSKAKQHPNSVCAEVIATAIFLPNSQQNIPLNTPQTIPAY